MLARSACQASFDFACELCAQRGSDQFDRRDQRRLACNALSFGQFRVMVIAMCAVEVPTNRSARDIWDNARSQLRLQLPRSTYETWVRDTECLAHEDGAFVIGVGNAYAKDWLSLRLRPLIKRTLAGIVGRTVEVTFVVQATPVADDPDAPPAPLLATDTQAEPAPVEPQMTYGADLSAP